MKKLLSGAQSAMTGSISVNFVLSLVIGLSLKQLWLLLNTLQLFTSLPLINISMPSILLVLC